MSLFCYYIHSYFGFKVILLQFIVVLLSLYSYFGSHGKSSLRIGFTDHILESLL